MVVSSVLAEAVVFHVLVVETGVGKLVAFWPTKAVPFAGDPCIGGGSKAVPFTEDLVHWRLPPILPPLVLLHETFAFMLIQVPVLYISMYSSLHPH